MIPPPSDVCVVLVADIEAFRPVAYLDGKGPKAVWTLGYGTVHRPDGSKVKQGDTVSEPEAKQWLLLGLTKAMQESLNKPLETTVSLEQHHVDSLCSLIYNIGPSAFAKSTLFKLLKEKELEEKAAAQFLRWNKDHGKVVNGLTRRRKTEQLIFLGHDPWEAWRMGWVAIKRDIPPGNPFAPPTQVGGPT